MPYLTPVVQTDIAACCGNTAQAVYFNPYNLVVQCHSCGHVYEPKVSDNGDLEVSTAEAVA